MKLVITKFGLNSPISWGVSFDLYCTGCSEVEYLNHLSFRTIFFSFRKIDVVFENLTESYSHTAEFQINVQYLLMVWRWYNQCLNRHAKYDLVYLVKSVSDEILNVNLRRQQHKLNTSTNKVSDQYLSFIFYIFLISKHTADISD